MECISCGSAINLDMYPLRWEDEGNPIGFIFVCSVCHSEEDLKIRWLIDDGDLEEEIE